MGLLEEFMRSLEKTIEEKINEKDFLTEEYVSELINEEISNLDYLNEDDVKDIVRESIIYDLGKEIDIKIENLEDDIIEMKENLDKIVEEIKGIKDNLKSGSLSAQELTDMINTATAENVKLHFKFLMELLNKSFEEGKIQQNNV